MAERFEERLCELVRNYKHLYDVTSPGHRDKRLLQNSWEEIRREIDELDGSEGKVEVRARPICSRQQAHEQAAWGCLHFCLFLKMYSTSLQPPPPAAL